MADKQVVQSGGGGIGLFGALFILFTGLKLGGVIDWSWWWVTAPLWGPFAAIIVGLIIFFAIAFAVELFKK